MSQATIPGTSVPTNTLAQRFKSLHVPGKPVLLANVQDAPSAKSVASNPSTTAIATASWAVAATQGLADSDLTLEGNLQGIRNVVAGIRNAGKIETLPLTADLQDGYADIAQTIREVIKAGVVGANIEDLNNANRPETLRDAKEATERIRTAMAAAKEAGVPDFVINARTDVLGFGGSIADCIERGKMFLDAGATTVFVWGCGKHVITFDEAKEMSEKFNGKLALQGPGPTPLSVQQLREAGISRISMGPWFHLQGMKTFEKESAVFLSS